MDLDVSVKHWRLTGRERPQAQSQCPREDGVKDGRLSTSGHMGTEEHPKSQCPSSF